ncbi:glycine/sarcosine/betaine reductase component B subunit, partial [Enterocloster bolteae]
MKLELGCVQINDIQFASESKVENGTIYVNAEELKALLLEDENLKSVELEIAKPGESVRIMPVKDVIEPRVKVNGGGNLFPGVISKVETVGSGRTNVLKGSAVVTTGKIVGFQEGIIDMCGEGAKYTPFSQLNNLVVVCEPIDGLAKHAHEKAVRFAGLKAADYIGKLAKDVEPDEVKVYETCSVKEGIEKYPELPRVAYVLMLQSQGLMHDTYVYGVDMKQS